MKSARVLSCAALVVLLSTAGPGAAQAPMGDPLDTRDARRVDRMEQVVRELRDIVFQLRDSGRPVVVQPADTDVRLVELAGRIADLEETLRRLNGTLETATHELNLARGENDQLRSELAALGKRLAAVEERQGPAEPGPLTDAPPGAARDPGADFERARQLMLGGDYDGAEAAFAGFVRDHPDTTRSPEARYWWGKTLSVRGAQTEAASAYIGALRGWPQTAWAPDAVGELARSLLAMKQPRDACQALDELRRRYPKAPASVSSRANATRAQAKCA